MTLARVTGVFYLLIIVLGIFSEVVIRGGLVVPGDAAATAANILGSELFFRASIAGDVVVFLSDVVVAGLLYVLLRPVSETLALVSAALRLTGTAIYGANLFNQLAAVILLGGAESFVGLDPGQLQAMALFFMELHGHGYDLGLVFFGAHCLTLGYLLFRSDLFPSWLGVLIVLAGFGYLVGSFTLFLFPNRADAVAPIYVVPLVGELALCVWLMVKGAKRVA
jgi:hypothetical protein